MSIDNDKLGIMTARLGKILKTENKIELVLNCIDELRELFHFKTISFFVLSPNYKQMLSRNISKDKQKFIFKVGYTDQADLETT